MTIRVGGDVDRPLEIFFSYAHEDEDLMNDVRRQLIVYERNGRILKWHDRMIPPGTEWRDRIDFRLEAAQVVLLFMSPHFIESRYCYEVEGEAALRRHEAGEARVVPIILRPCAWEATPFGALQALPANAKPISRWIDRDEACLAAARGVMRVVDELTESRGAFPPCIWRQPHLGPRLPGLHAWPRQRIRSSCTVEDAVTQQVSRVSARVNTLFTNLFQVLSVTTVHIVVCVRAPRLFAPANTHITYSQVVLRDQ
jgi:TIR domain